MAKQRKRRKPSRPPHTLRTFWDEQGKWSEATFGTKSQRGPIGPLKHLVREVLTELLGVPREAVDAVLALCNPDPHALADVKEYVDAQFLVTDAIRRAHFTYGRFMKALFAKLDENKAREWPPFNPDNVDDAVEHVRGTCGPAPGDGPETRIIGPGMRVVGMVAAPVVPGEEPPRIDKPPPEPPPEPPANATGRERLNYALNKWID